MTLQSPPLDPLTAVITGFFPFATAVSVAAIGVIRDRQHLKKAAQSNSATDSAWGVLSKQQSETIVNQASLIKSLQGQVDDLYKRMNTFDAQYAAVIAERDTARKERDTALNQVTTLTARITTLENENAQQNGQIAALTKQNGEQDAMIKSLQAQIAGKTP